MEKCKITFGIAGVVWQGRCATHEISWVAYKPNRPKLCPFASEMSHLTPRAADCDHEWVNGNNEVVSNCLICKKCHTVTAANANR